jgi:hypothetical protein
MDSISPFVLSEWNEGRFMGNFMGFFGISAKLQKGRFSRETFSKNEFGRLWAFEILRFACFLTIRTSFRTFLKKCVI